jgi:hypothetical protein
MRARARAGRAASSSAFTRIELAATAGVVFLLALLFVAWTQHLKARRLNALCAGNLKGLSQAFLSYGQQSTRYPLAARLGSLQSDDWIYWQVQKRALADSAIAPYLPRFDAAKLRCAKDARCRFRPYQFSYSMNAAMEHRGTGDVPRPATTPLLFEEASPNDGCCAAGSAADRLTDRHGAKGWAGFADGHLELVLPTYPSAPLNNSAVE